MQAVSRVKSSRTFFTKLPDKTWDGRPGYETSVAVGVCCEGCGGTHSADTAAAVVN